MTMGNELKHEVGCLFWELPIELCPVCIPVPQSLPAQPALLTDEELELTVSRILADCDSLTEVSDSVWERYRREAKEIIAKCQQSEAAIRADQSKKIATWIQKNDNHFIFHFIPECGGDFCFLATEAMENECAEPDEGAGHCQYRDKCRYANKQLLFGQNFIAKLQKGDSPE